MLSAVEMSRLTMAGSRSDLDEALRLCADLGNVLWGARGAAAGS